MVEVLLEGVDVLPERLDGLVLALVYVEDDDMNYAAVLGEDRCNFLADDEIVVVLKFEGARDRRPEPIQ